MTSRLTYTGRLAGFAALRGPIPEPTLDIPQGVGKKQADRHRAESFGFPLLRHVIRLKLAAE